MRHVKQARQPVSLNAYNDCNQSLWEMKLTSGLCNLDYVNFCLHMTNHFEKKYINLYNMELFAANHSAIIIYSLI